MWLLVGSFLALAVIFAGGLTMPKKKGKNICWQERIFGPGVDFIQRFVIKDDDFFRETMPKVLAVVWILLCLLLCLLLSGSIVSGDIAVSDIRRNTYSGGEKKERVYVETEDGKEMEIEVAVSQQEYSQKEVDDFFRQAKEKLPELILGDNESLDAVFTELNLVTEVEGNPVSIVWEPLADEVDKITQVKATISFNERKEELVIPIGHREEKKSEELIFREKLEAELKKSEEKDRTDEIVELPQKVGNQSVRWFKKGSGSVEGAVFFVLLVGALVFWKEKDARRKQEEEKKNRLLLEYPELVSKLTLLLGAGLTLQRAWEKIAKEYKEKRENGKIAVHNCYEEMYLTYKELERGIPMKTALDSFGKRIGIPRYLKLSTLLVQNLRRGSAGLLERLEIEAVDSFEERKAIARQMGEKAGTKLLFPMMLMLVIVMVLIMVPAFFSFNL